MLLSVINNTCRGYTYKDIENIAFLMGEDYVTLIEKLKREKDKKKHLDIYLSLKLYARSNRDKTGNEFKENDEQIYNMINKHMSVIYQDLSQIQENSQHAIKAELQRRSDLSTQWFKSQRDQYNKKYIDFPELNISKINKKSKAENIMRRLLNGIIKEVDYIWLKEKNLVNHQIKLRFYTITANNYRKEWEKTGKAWSLVNALANYRKGCSLKPAIELINMHYPYDFANNDNKLKSALLTSTGGVKRDLYLYTDAISLGKEAHLLANNNYRPCTLIGAANILSGNILEGHKWYKKAISLGFNPDTYKSEIKMIYSRVSNKDKMKIKKTLLCEGFPSGWVNNLKAM